MTYRQKEGGERKWQMDSSSVKIVDMRKDAYFRQMLRFLRHLAQSVVER